VLVAGALAAPRGGKDANTDTAAVVVSDTNDPNAILASLPAYLSYEGSDDEHDDDRYEHDDEHDDERHGDNHEEDDD